MQGKDVRPTKFKECKRCGEVWPLTLEFFRVNPKRGIPRYWDSWCKACLSEANRERKQRKKYTPFTFIG